MLEALLKSMIWSQDHAGFAKLIPLATVLMFPIIALFSTEQKIYCFTYITQ